MGGVNLDRPSNEPHGIVAGTGEPAPRPDEEGASEQHESGHGEGELGAAIDQGVPSIGADGGGGPEDPEDEAEDDLA
eukprot:4861992-Lingulodinium_polyedra.AAC.1